MNITFSTKNVSGTCYYSYFNLTSLKGGLKFVHTQFYYCQGNKLTTLLYSPKTSHKFSAEFNVLISLDYVPNHGSIFYEKFSRRNAENR